MASPRIDNGCFDGMPTVGLYHLESDAYFGVQ